MYVYSSSVECVFKNQNESSIKNRKKRKIEIETKKEKKTLVPVGVTNRDGTFSPGWCYPPGLKVLL